MNKIGIKLLRSDAKVPKMQREGDAAFDLYAAEDVEIPSQGYAHVSCGIALEIPSGYKVMINGRSGLASKGVQCHTGTIDENYKGNIGTILYNWNTSPYKVLKGDRVGQLSLQKVVPTIFEEIDELSSSNRGDKGFGSSGR